MSWNAGTGILSWTAALEIYSVISGFRLDIPAGNVTVLDGEVFFVNLTRAPTLNVTLGTAVALQVPNTDSAFALAVRRGTDIFWRHGVKIATGETFNIFELVQVPVGATGNTLISTIRAGDIESHDSATPKIVSQFQFNPTDYALSGTTRTLVFRAVAANGGGVASTNVRLFNLTDGETIATLNFTSSSPTVKEAALTEGAGAGQIDLADKVYEVRIFVDAPDAIDDTIELGSAELRVINTVN